MLKAETLKIGYYINSENLIEMRNDTFKKILLKLPILFVYL